MGSDKNFILESSRLCSREITTWVISRIIGLKIYNNGTGSDGVSCSFIKEMFLEKIPPNNVPAAMANMTPDTP
jgi:hypothetical protein